MRQKLEDGGTDAIRELGFNIKTIGIDVARCAGGVGISSTIKKLDVNENQFISFINDAYEYCKDLV